MYRHSTPLRTCPRMSHHSPPPPQLQQQQPQNSMASPSTNGSAPNRNRPGGRRHSNNHRGDGVGGGGSAGAGAGALGAPVSPVQAHHRRSHPALALDAFRRHSVHSYQSFPSPLHPPKKPGKPLRRDHTPSRPPPRTVSDLSTVASSSASTNAGSVHREPSTSSISSARRYLPLGKTMTVASTASDASLAAPVPTPTPIPTRKLLVLALIALAEQTAFNSISPYLPEMVGQFPDVEPGNVGVSVGIIASSFAVAQFVTNFFWGNLSDRIGRKPVILCGTILTAGAFVMWAFTTTLWQAVIVHATMGIVNGNQGVVSTVLGEITDRSNQSAAFAYLPVVYGVGGILGPILGGLLSSSKESSWGIVQKYPYCLPNLASAVLLGLDFLLCVFFLDESLAEARELPPLTDRIRNLFSWLWQFTSAIKPTYLRKGKNKPRNGNAGRDRSREPLLRGNHADVDVVYTDDHGLFAQSKPVPWKDIMKPSTIVLLATYFIFNLAMVGYNALYPIFVSSPPPTGRATSVQEIGLSLAFAGLVTIVFQVLFFARLQHSAGNDLSFKGALGLFAATFFVMPLIGYEGGIGKLWLWMELAGVLTVKVVTSITALTCAMIMITNCAPDHSSLGSINGLAQTLSAAGRAFGPFVAGGLFTVGTRFQRGEWIPWGSIGGIAVIGFVVSFGIGKQTAETGQNRDVENGAGRTGRQR
ncbi:Major facilitator superfamily multidrug transporter [Drechslerella dactyloides]|uniref:Major facilitator superfamily multidrug transporter n=1 Tax=Drechslerella dactyloides TaxID=74499 RepID=A0AAD6IYX9_DREDA|nr:Major facilitator superfamily multidrug transporter [Drechslerella dactyloides]